MTAVWLPKMVVLPNVNRKSVGGLNAGEGQALCNWLGLTGEVLELGDSVRRPTPDGTSRPMTESSCCPETCGRNAVSADAWTVADRCMKIGCIRHDEHANLPTSPTRAYSSR